MDRIQKIIITALLLPCLVAILAACGNTAAPETPYKENQTWIDSADKASLGFHFSLQDDMKWGMTLAEVRGRIDGPFENDYETYLSKWISAALPADDRWKADSQKIDPDTFAEVEVLSYYSFNNSGILTEYGYQCLAATLEQYDFLKAYYTKKYGEPSNTEFIWKDESYKPDGTEDLYAMFKDGLVKVLTVWEINEVGSVLVVDWLNDPADEKNNFGQISFYEKTHELEY